MEERKCFGYRGFEHVAHHCRNIEEERPILVLSNKFEVLKDRVIQKGKGGRGEVRKDRKENKVKSIIYNSDIISL